jgi:hypothetical protein
MSHFAFASPCGKSPDRQLDPIKSHPIDDRDDGCVCGSKPGLDVSKGQEKGNAKSGNPGERRSTLVGLVLLRDQGTR